MQTTLENFHPEFLRSLEAHGYEALRTCGAEGLCAVKRFNFTWGLVVNLDPASHDRRYCYEHRGDAVAALADWDGVGHPSGPWIKCKGARVDLLNPAFGRESA